MEGSRGIAQRLWGWICALGLGIKVAFGFIGLGVLWVVAYGRKQRDLGAAREKAKLRLDELDAAADAGDAEVQAYIEKRAREGR